MTKSEIKLRERLKKRIALGAKWLTKHDGDWVKNTNLDKLDMGSTGACMLGQAFDDFWQVISATVSKKTLTLKQAKFHGFYLFNEEAANYDLLSELWTNEIKRRRAKREAAKKKRV